MTHDGITHLWRIARLDEYIRSGVFYPRWMPEMLLGYGYPVLNFYASASYYLVELFHLLGLSLYRSFMVVQWLLMYLAAVGMFLLARDFYGKQDSKPALVASVVYAYGPYLLINMYVRGAIAELGAQMLLPWILWSFRRIWRAEQPRASFFIATISLGGLALTHTISLLLVPPLLLVYLLVLAYKMPDWPRRARWSALAIVGAMTISAFYWLPLIFERSFITETGMVIATVFMLPKSFYNFSNFLDLHWLYYYPGDPPWKIGILQMAGTVIALPFALSSTREWRFWLGVMLVSILMMIEPAKWLWFSNDILPIIQFPWRLLAFIQLPIALLFGLPITYISNRLLRTAVAVVLIAVAMWVHLPRLHWEYILAPTASSFNMAVNSYFDAGRGRIVEGELGNASVQEFRPKWTTQSLQLDPTTVDAEPIGYEANPPVIDLIAADHFSVEMATTSVSSFPLRLTSYYFPGWRVTLDGNAELIPYPSTNLGLLTVEVPSGEHTLTVAWFGTPIAFWATILSQIALALLVVWQLFQPGAHRWWGLALLALLPITLWSSYIGSSPQSVQRVRAVQQPPGIRLLGYRGPQLSPDGIQVFPYWYVTQTAPDALQLHWQLRSEAGQLVQEMVSDPFYDSYSTEQLAISTLFDDAHLIPLPPDLPAGSYTLTLSVLDGASGSSYFTQELGAITLTRRTQAVTPENALEVYYGDEIMLTGYDLRTIARLLPSRLYPDPEQEFNMAQAGDSLAYTLYWRTKGESDEPLVGFVHLVDRFGRPIAQQDQSPGPLLQPVGIWTAYGVYPDRYLLEIPPESESGVYWPHVGMYDWREQHRFDVRVPGRQETNDHFELPAIKVVNPQVRASGTRVDVRFGVMADLLRYQVASPNSDLEASAEAISIRPGDALTLTLYYKALAPTARAMKRFVQIRDQNQGIVAQNDGEPQDGHNPTWSWAPGEIIRDTIPLLIPDTTALGDYTLYIGFYDSAEGAQRLPATPARAEDLPDGELPLLEVSVVDEAN